MDCPCLLHHPAQVALIWLESSWQASVHEQADRIWTDIDKALDVVVP